MRFDRESVNLPTIAKDTHGYVGADLAALCSSSAEQCIRECQHLIDIEDENIPKEVL